MKWAFACNLRASNTEYNRFVWQRPGEQFANLTQRVGQVLFFKFTRHISCSDCVMPKICLRLVTSQKIRWCPHLSDPSLVSLQSRISSNVVLLNETYGLSSVPTNRGMEKMEAETAISIEITIESVTRSWERSGWMMQRYLRRIVIIVIRSHYVTMLW
jgi:hypothetical protein